MATATLHRAFVKSVISGDTLVIKPIVHSSASATQDNEQRISLHSINAPKLARPPTDAEGSASANDEPYAFECREYLRKKLVGREICYTVDFQVPQSLRLMCSVCLGNDPNTGENIVESLLAEGLVGLRAQTGARASDPKYRRLLAIDESAKANRRGRYSGEPASAHIRNIKWTLDNPRQFVDAHRLSAPIDAIIEFIRDGNTVRCLLLPSYHFVTVQLTGIRCPALQRDDAASSESHEPFAVEAKQFVETRLLQRQVKVVLQGVNNQNLFATLLHPNGNIGVFLLKEGLARCADWSLSLLPKEQREGYRAAEKYAKDNRLRIWQSYAAPPVRVAEPSVVTTNGNSHNLSSKDYQAQVLEVINGDAMTIRDLRDQSIRKIYLSSVRAPRAADFQPKSTDPKSTATRTIIKRPLFEIPYLFDAHDLLRKRLIGKTVRVVTDYVQTANDEYAEKVCCTVYVGNVNVGEALISKGLAKAIRHRQNDEQRSSHHDDLLAAEQQAEKRGLGLFSHGTGLYRIVDLTGDGNKERAKSSLTALQRNGRMAGVVEYVAGASRFRVHLSKDNWIISFLLSAVSCPRAERRATSTKEKAEPGQPFGAEAWNFSREHFLQRDVLIEVEGMDRGGSFIGRLTTSDGQSAALMLVQAGLAKVHDSALNAPNYKELLEAQEECKKQRLGVWTDYEEPKETEAENEPAEIQEHEPEIVDFNDSKFRRVLITYITSDLKVYVQFAAQGQKLEQLQADLREYFTQNPPAGGHTPKKGELLAARFSADNEWYRARVEKIEGNTRVFVYFLDYGNREVITDLSHLATLPANFSQLPGQAHEYELAYVRSAPDEDDRREAQLVLNNEIANEECLVKVEYRQNGSEYVLLYRASTKDNLVKSLAEQGLVIVGKSRGNRQRRSPRLLDELEQAQAKAKAARRGLWQYSDQIEDDATEFGFTGRK